MDASKNIQKRITAFENKWKILKVSWTEHQSIESIYKQLGLNDGHLIRHVKKQKIKYYGQVKRHSTLKRTILEGKVDGSRGR